MLVKKHTLREIHYFNTMKSGFITICFVISALLLHAQKKESNLFPYPSMGYFYQGTHNLFFEIGPAYLFKEKHVVALQGGVQFFRTQKTGYFPPIITLKYYYGSHTNRFRPIINLNYTSYKINNQQDNYLSLDIGHQIHPEGLNIFIGYNYNLDKKDINLITPYRIGIRLF